MVPPDTSSSEQSVGAVFELRRLQRIAQKYAARIPADLCRRLLEMDFAVQWRPVVAGDSNSPARSRIEETPLLIAAIGGSADSLGGYVSDSFCAQAVTVDGVSLGTAILSSRPADSTPPHPKGRNTRGQGKPPKQKAGELPMPPRSQLLRLLVGYIEAATLAEVRDEKAERQLVRSEALRFEEAEEKSHSITTSAASCLPEEESHGEQLIHRMLDEMHQHYAEPLTLTVFAGKLRLNAAYLCDLFTRTVGTSFKRYLTRLRIDKAKTLLGDPTYRLAEIASMVGYTDANRFRLAFKAATGLSPATWRQTWHLPLDDQRNDG